MLERAADDIEDEVEDKVAKINGTIPEVEGNNTAAEQALDDIELLDLVPLRDLVEGGYTTQCCNHV